MNPVGIVLMSAAGLLALAWGWADGAPSLAPGLAMAGGGLALGFAAATGLRRLRAVEPPGPASLPEVDPRELAGLRRALGEARAEIDTLHTSVSHDLRSPIGAILNFLTVLEEDHGAELAADGRAILARIRRSADSALALLDGLARLSRVERKTIARRSVDVEPLVRAGFAAARPSNRAVELTVVGPLPPAFADPELLRTAFAELLANAVRFSAGREKATVTVGGRLLDDGAVEYWVADDGVGFDPRFAGKLFKAFERLHSRDQFPGAGAGLAIVRRVAERHGGSVRADGELQRGATFHLVLPARPAAATGAPEAWSASPDRLDARELAP
jgi:signal transduction histidine kinase